MQVPPDSGFAVIMAQNGEGFKSQSSGAAIGEERRSETAKFAKKRIAKRCKACYNALCVRPKGAAPTLGCRQAVRHQTLTLAFVGSNPAIPAKSDPLAQLAEQLPFKQWVRGSNPRRVTRKSTLRRAFSLISEDQRPFEIKGLTVCCAHALAACGLLSSARFLILLPD